MIIGQLSLLGDSPFVYQPVSRPRAKKVPNTTCVAGFNRFNSKRRGWDITQQAISKDRRCAILAPEIYVDSCGTGSLDETTQCDEGTKTKFATSCAGISRDQHRVGLSRLISALDVRSIFPERFFEQNKVQISCR